MPRSPFDPISFEVDPYRRGDQRDARPNYGYGSAPAQQADPYVRELETKVEQQTAKLKEQDAILKAVATPPLLRGMVVAQGVASGKDDKGQETPGTVLVSGGQGVMEVAVPPKTTLEVGDVVRVSPKSMGIVDKVVQDHLPQGAIVTVAGILDANTIEIEQGTGKRTVTHSLKVVDKGDRVLTDPSMSYVVRNLGKQTDDFKADSEKIATTWDDVGGQTLAKTEMREAIEGPIMHKEIFEAYGKKAVKGVLLFGPPGCGKTLLAKAAANAIAKLHGKAVGTGFIYVKGPEILNKWVGQSEETIRNLFQRARDHFKREGFPAVLFIDEADAIMGARGTSSMVTGMEKTIVPMFLAEMDGLDENGPLVLLATNRADSLDPAVVRDGRVDRKIEVTRPNVDDSAQIFSMYLRGKPFAAVIENGESQAVTRDAFAEVFADELFKSTLKVRVCGALIAGLVDQAVSMAMRRDIASGSKTPTGLTRADITAAVKAVEAQNMKVANG